MTFTACVSLWKASIHVSVLYVCCENVHLLCFPLPKRQECCMWNKPKFSKTRGQCSHFHNFIFCCGKIFFVFIAIWILYFFFHHQISADMKVCSTSPKQRLLFFSFQDPTVACFTFHTVSPPKHITLTHKTYCFWSNLVQCKLQLFEIYLLPKQPQDVTVVTNTNVIHKTLVQSL